MIIVIGDGFILGSLKKYHKYNKSFMELIPETMVLMNKFSTKHTIKTYPNHKSCNNFTIRDDCKNKSNITKKSIAINEVSILRQDKQAASLSISNNTKTIIRNLVSEEYWYHTSWKYSI